MVFLICLEFIRQPSGSKLRIDIKGEAEGREDTKFKVHNLNLEREQLPPLPILQLQRVALGLGHKFSLVPNPCILPQTNSP